MYGAHDITKKLPNYPYVPALERPFSSSLLLFVVGNKHTNLLGALLGLSRCLGQEKHKTSTDIQGAVSLAQQLEVNPRIIATAAGPLASACGYPGPAPAQSLPVPSHTYWELSKGAFPRSCCLCLGNSSAGLNLERLVFGEKELSWLQSSSRSPGRAGRAAWTALIPTITELPCFSSSFFSWGFFSSQPCYHFVILGDVSSVFKLLLCCPRPFCSSFFLCSLFSSGSAAPSHPKVAVITTTPHLPLADKFGPGLQVLTSETPSLQRFGQHGGQEADCWLEGKFFA